MWNTIMMDNIGLGLVDLPPGFVMTVGSKWLFKKKTDMDGIVHVYKARLVAKGYTQLYGVDYEETFSPVADIRAIRILISIAAYYDYEIWKMDVKTTFLNGYLDEDIYMVQPEGFVDPNHPRKVCKLQRSIYGLKQASRSWNKRFDEEIKRFGFAQNLDEPCVYQKASGSNVTFLILYVDDIIIMGNHIPSLQSVKDYLGKCFAMKDLGEAAFILGIKIYRDRSKRLIGLSQNAYMDKILKRYKMDNSKRGHIPMQERLDLNKSQGAQSLREILKIVLVYGGNPSTELRVEAIAMLDSRSDRDDHEVSDRIFFVLNWRRSGLESSKLISCFRIFRDTFSAILPDYFIASLLRIMPPRRRLKKVSVKRLVERRVAKAIEEYEKSRANLDGAGSSGGKNMEMLEELRWIEKVEQVFETGKCAEEDKVMFASTFEGRALTWWNGNVHTLWLVNANRIPWTEFKMMMTTEYCLAIETQKIEQELWTLTLKGDDIEAYNNRFHELALICPELVPTERKKIEKYVRGFPERIKGNTTSSKPATLHDAINMARELVEQSVQGRDM
ncbi:retrotransposon protein, putative, ty1-copia subclass [Tanacetum coccineum]